MGVASRTGPSGRPRRWLMLVFAGVAIVCAALVMLLLGAAAIGVLGGFSDLDDSGYGVSVDTERVAFDVELPREQGVTSIRIEEEDGCPTFYAYFGGDLTVEAYGESCQLEEQSNAQIGNGSHGRYRSLDEVAEPIRVQEVATDLGPAQVFEQSYFECTNFCDEWQEPVAIVRLEHPADPEFSTLVLRSDKGELSREEFTEVVRSLDTPR